MAENSKVGYRKRPRPTKPPPRLRDKEEALTNPGVETV